MFVYICGVSAAGKTTLSRGLADLYGAKVYGGSEKVMAHCGVVDREEYYNQYINRITEWVIPYHQAAYEEDASDPLTLRIMDIHFHYFRPNGDIKQPIYDWHRRNLLGVVLLEVPVEIIAARRFAEAALRPDRNRTRSAIVEEIQAEREAAYTTALYLRVPLQVVSSHRIKETLEESVAHIRSWQEQTFCVAA